MKLNKRRITDELERQGLKPVEAAAKCGISKGSWSEIMSSDGKDDIRISTLGKIAKGLKIEPADLLK